MFRFSKVAVLTLAAILTSGPGLADDNAELNAVYRGFLGAEVDVAKVGMFYGDDVIHVGAADSPLLIGKETFMATNIQPLADRVNAGQLQIEGKFYIMRRIISGDMANDVGYMYLRMKEPNGDHSAHVQKFSWVFVRAGDTWQVVTDFDSTQAPLSVLEKLRAQIIIE